MWPEEALRDLVGTPFPGGTFTIEPWAHWLFCDVVRSPEPAGGEAHPIYAYHACRAGMGLSIDELLALFGCRAADGPVFGEHETELLGPILVGATYRIEGEVRAAERKEGRRTGVFDIVTFELRLLDSADEPVAVTRNSFVVPRRAA